MPNSDPLYLPYEQQIRYEVEKVHAKGCCVDCLTSVLAHPELCSWFEEDGEDGLLFAGETEARIYAEMFTKYREPASAWLHIFGSLVGLLGPGRPIGPEIDARPVSETALNQMVDTILSHHDKIDFSAGQRHLPKETVDVLAPLIKVLDAREKHKERPAPPAKQVHTARVRKARDEWQPFHDPRHRPNDAPTVAVLKDDQSLLKSIDLQLVIDVGRTGACQYPSDFENPKRLEYWLLRFRWSVLKQFLPTFQKQSDDSIGHLAHAISNALQNSMETIDSLASHNDPELAPWRDHRGIPAELSAELTPYLAKLLSRLESKEADTQLLWMCWRYATWIHGDTPDGLDPTTRKRLRQMARDELGRLRTLARQADTKEAKENFLKRYVAFGYYDDLLTYVCRFGGIWDALKPLLLAMRALNVPGVASDLRTWNEPEFDQVSVWAQIPNWTAGILNGHAWREEQVDPRLELLRQEFATFCLERLKTGENGGPVEPSAIWRQGYIRAVRDLRVNPRGRGHHILHHAHKNDPDPAVQAAADAAYTEMRHDEKLPANRSPRRAILGALWWLKRAHFIELCGEAALDQRGALRTRNRESRRTT